MTEKPLAERNPKRVANGYATARKRWGAGRLVRLDGLTDEQKLVIADLVRELRAAAEASRQ